MEHTAHQTNGCGAEGIRGFQFALREHAALSYSLTGS
jgi:hypothetical protein